MTTTTPTAGWVRLAAVPGEVHATVRQAPTPPKKPSHDLGQPSSESHMFVAYIIVAGVFTVMLTMSARMKLVHDPLAVEVIGGVVGVPLRLFPVLAFLELAGAVGLLIGIGVNPRRRRRSWLGCLLHRSDHIRICASATWSPVTSARP